MPFLVGWGGLSCVAWSVTYGMGVGIVLGIFIGVGFVGGVSPVPLGVVLCTSGTCGLFIGGMGVHTFR